MSFLARFAAFSGKLGRKPGLLTGAALFFASSLFGTALYAQPSAAARTNGSDAARVKQISFKGSGDMMEVEIQTSTAIVPESQSLASPDRIIIDFPGALPGVDLHSINLNYGILKAIRTGLFSANPPITRVVFDLSEPQPYQVVASENKVTLKLRLTSSAARTSAAPGAPAAAALARGDAASAATPTGAAVPAPHVMNVSFQRGLLRIHAKGATLAEVLFEVQKQTGAEIPIPAGAEQEIVAADVGPAPPRDVLAALLNGSRYNFIFIGNERDHTLQKAILSLR